MATTINNSDFRSKIAGEDLTDYQNYFVTLESDGQLDKSDSTSDNPYGVLLTDEGTTGKECRVAVSGEAKVVSSELLAIGVYVASSDAGKAQTAVSGQYPKGVVVQASGADLDLCTIQLITSAVPLA